MKPWFIYLISILYSLQAVQAWMDKQYAAGFLVLFYALAGIPLIFMTQH